MAENTVPGSGLRLARSDGQLEPGWRLTPNRRLRLVVSQAQPIDALDLEWASAEQKYPHWKDSIAELKALIRQRRAMSDPPAPKR